MPISPILRPVFCLALAGAALLSGPTTSLAQAAAAPVNGEARDDPDTRAGFRVYFSPLRIWLEPDVFWYRWADDRKAFLWNGAATAPEGPEVEEGNMFILETDHGPCLLVRKDKRWQKAGDVYGWGERLRNYGGCAKVTLAKQGG